MRRLAGFLPLAGLLPVAGVFAVAGVLACGGTPDRPDSGPTDAEDFEVPPIARGAGGETPATAVIRLPDSFGVGSPASAARIDSVDIDVRPDGTGLPPGGGSADEGAAVYSAYCAHCHGASGTGGSARPLVTEEELTVPGFPFATIPYYLPTVGTYWPYAPTLFDYVRKAMPQDAPGSLSNDQVYAVTAWILWRNRIVGRDSVMDATTLPEVVMPARGRFVVDRRRGGSEIR